MLLRAQVYYKDMGLFRKSHIIHMTREIFDGMNKSKTHKAIELTPDNWYGENLPETLR
ncbi:MAG: hypothetical protein ACM3TR_09920 [Caulobacteraceae bacterium]